MTDDRLNAIKNRLHSQAADNSPTPSPTSIYLPATLSDSFTAAARALPQFGAVLNFNGQSGSWLKDGRPLDPNCRFFPKDVRYGHRYLKTGEHTEDYPAALGEQLQDRKTLPHLDEALWDIGDNGRPVDPVKKYVLLGMICLNDGCSVIYEALAPTAFKATVSFISRVVWERAMHTPEAQPLVTLGSLKESRGARSWCEPSFNMTNWLVPDGHGTWRPEAEVQKPTTGKIIDDHLPW